MILASSGCKTTEYISDRCLTDSYAPYVMTMPVHVKAWIVDHNCDQLKMCEPEKYETSNCKELEQ